MARKSFAETIMDIKVMVAGLKGINNNLPAGVKPTTPTEMETKIGKLEQLNSEQEGIKAQLKAKTEEIDQLMKELESQAADTKKRIKLDIPPSNWKSFGIDDKK